MRVELQPAYILHSRPFRDSSLILECLTRDYGRLAMVARAARSPKSRQRQLCQPFQPLLLSWQGKGNMKSLLAIERGSASPTLQGDHLYSGFYLNEVLLRLLPEADACSEIFQRYATALNSLAQGLELEPLLRETELGLLSDLGYGIDLRHEADRGALVQAAGRYTVEPDRGVVVVKSVVAAESVVVVEGIAAEDNEPNRYFSGRCLLAIADGDYSAAETRRQAKLLTRQLLQPLLGVKPLKSRELFTAVRPRGVS